MLNVVPLSLTSQRPVDQHTATHRALRGSCVIGFASTLLIVCVWLRHSGTWPGHASHIEEAGSLAIVQVGGDSRKPQQLIDGARGDGAKMQRAYDSIVKMVDASPEDASLKVSAGNAAVSLMRIRTNANSLVVRLDKNGVPQIEQPNVQEHMKLWSDWAPTAQRLLEEGRAGVGEKSFLQDPSSFTLSVEAVMYATASRGIVSAVMSGKAIGFLSAVTQLEKLHPKFDGHIYCIYWGAYYLAAPWPATSPAKARVYFERAVKAAPASRRNQYWAGVAAFMEGDFDAAKTYMERAPKEKCASPSEQDICKFLTTEAKRVLDLLASKDL